MMLREMTLDIETGPLSDTDKAIEQATLAPDGRATTDEGKKKSVSKKIATKEGLLNLTPIVCIGTICDTLHINFTTLPLTQADLGHLLLPQASRPYPIVPMCFDAEIDLLRVFIEFCRNVTNDQTTEITHNGKNFDNPHILLRSAYYDVWGCAFLSPSNRHQHFDTMERFGWSFAHLGEEKKFVSLERVCASLGIPFRKGLDSAQIPKLVKNRKSAVEIIEYNQADCQATQQAAYKMQSQM